MGRGAWLAAILALKVGGWGGSGDGENEWIFRMDG